MDEHPYVVRWKDKLTLLLSGEKTTPWGIVGTLSHSNHKTHLDFVSRLVQMGILKEHRRNSRHVDIWCEDKAALAKLLSSVDDLKSLLVAVGYRLGDTSQMADDPSKVTPADTTELDPDDIIGGLQTSLLRAAEGMDELRKNLAKAVARIDDLEQTLVTHTIWVTSLHDCLAKLEGRDEPK